MTGPAIKSIFLFIIGLNIATILFMGINVFKSSGESDHLAYYTFLQEMQDDVQENDESYRFINPSIAYRIWQQLDINEGRDERRLVGANYLGPGEGFSVNFDYCDEHRAYIVNNPEFVFQGKNFFTNYWETHKLRTQVIPAIAAHDLYPELIPGKRVKPANSDMRPDINIFITFNLFYYKRQVGKQFSCISQASNHIPGHDKMYRKDLLAQSLAVYAKKYTDRPQCFNYDKYFPKTWVLIKKDQCLEFFEEFNSPIYQELKEKRNVVYFRKIGAGVHEGKGVFPVNDKEEQYIRNLYRNGQYCGQIKENNLIQYNVYNTLLIENRKFGFRKFMLVASANPVIAYYHDGYARLSLNEYDPSSDEKKTFVTNIGVNLKEATQGTELQNMTPEQINDYTHWTLEDIANYLYKKGKINDPNWLNNSLKESFKKVMIHLIRMTQEGFFKKSSIYELYGLDFVMDEDLNLWFIEANSMPLVNGFTARSTIQMNQMLKDSFEIVLGLTKSRMKRVITFINMLTKAAPLGNIVNLEQRREEYKELTKNYFEPEFEPSPQSSFYKIIDETYTGVKRYSNLLEEQCL